MLNNMRAYGVRLSIDDFGTGYFLQSHGCDEMQGYYFAKPLPVQDCTAALIEHRCLR